MYNLKIDPDFKSLIPPLTPEEQSQLEENMATEGCRDAIKIWRGKIIDGHNRYGICKKLSLPFTTKTMHFPNKTDAKQWIIENQLGRRNLTDATRINLAASKAALISGSGSKRKSIAKDAGVSETTVHKYMQIKKLAHPELLKQVDNGDIKISAAHKSLELIVTTVEELYSADTSSPTTKVEAAAVADNIKKIGHFYKFLVDNTHNLYEANDIDNILKKLKSHERRTVELIKSCN